MEVEYFSVSILSLLKHLIPTKSRDEFPAFLRAMQYVYSNVELSVGRFNEYRYYFFEAIREMCERGIGKPVTPFRLLNITENSVSPVSLSDFM